MIWAQIFPFVALQLYEGDMKETITAALSASFTLWICLNVVFFCTIDLSYVSTFFVTKTASEYTVDLFLMSEEDSQKFDAVFTVRRQYTRVVHKEVKEWVMNNVQKWREEESGDWFRIELIPEDLLPREMRENNDTIKKKKSGGWSDNPPKVGSPGGAAVVYPEE